MESIQRILDSACGISEEYCSWEQYIRAIGLDSGMIHSATDAIYPVMGYDARFMDEPMVVGFALVPFFQDEAKHFCGLFFDYDDIDIFADYIDYVYEFEEMNTWATDTELLLYHNRAAVIDYDLQEEVLEFGFKEVVSAALRGQYDGHSSWAKHPHDVEV